MATGEMLEVEFPVMRYDITVPLIEGRVAVDGVKLKPVKTSSMISKEDPKLKAVEQALKRANRACSAGQRSCGGLSEIRSGI